MKSSGKKMGRRNSAENIINNHNMIGATTDSRNTLGDAEKILQRPSYPFKTSNSNNQRIKYKIKDRKSDKSNNSRNYLNSGNGSTGK